MTTPDKLLSLENAELFLQEARTPYELVLARNLVARLQELELLKQTALKTGILACDIVLKSNKESDNAR